MRSTSAGRTISAATMSPPAASRDRSSAWTDAAVNKATRNFFADTLATLQGSYLRGTHPGFITFFRACAHQAQAAIRGDLSASDLADWMNARHAETAGARARSPA